MLLLLPYLGDMATKPTTTAILYALTSSGACSVTLTQDGKSHTWQAIPENGGQTTFIIPAYAVAELSDENALLSPLPFKFAPGTGGVGGSIAAEVQKLLTLTAAESDAMLSLLTWDGLCAAADTDWLKNALLSCVSGNTAYINLSSCAAPASATPEYRTSTIPLLAGDNYKLKLGEGVPGLKRMVLRMNRFWYNGDMRLSCRNADVDFVLISNVLSASEFGRLHLADNYHRAKSITFIYPSDTNDKAYPYYVGNISTDVAFLDESKLNCPIRFILPVSIKGAGFKVYVLISGQRQEDTQITHLNITAAMPSYVDSFSFYKSNFNSVENLVYLMDNLGKPAAGNLPQLTFGIAAELVDMSGDEPVYADADLQSAVERLRAKGWEDVPSPVSEP